MQSSSDPLKFSILYTLTALSNPTGKVIDPKELQRKDSALAEVVAILTLKKKLDSRRGITDEAE